MNKWRLYNLPEIRARALNDVPLSKEEARRQVLRDLGLKDDDKMISINIHKNKRGQWQMQAIDAGSNNKREIIHSSGETPRDAAIWLLRTVNRLAAEIEARLVELGFLTEAECEAALAETFPEAATREEKESP